MEPKPIDHEFYSDTIFQCVIGAIIAYLIYLIWIGDDHRLLQLSLFFSASGYCLGIARIRGGDLLRFIVSLGGLTTGAASLALMTGSACAAPLNAGGYNHAMIAAMLSFWFNFAAVLFTRQYIHVSQRFLY